MGCSPSHQSYDVDPTQEGEEVIEGEQVHNEVPDVYKAGFSANDDKYKGHPFVDYRGVASSTSLASAKEKSDGVCVWADKVLAVREMTGSFIDPLCPSTWPKDVQDYYYEG